MLKTTIRRVVRAALAPLARTPLLGTITAVSTTEPLVALTFDDGPDPATTPRVLSLLDRYDAKATFFMVGERAAAHPDLVETVRERGHAIGNHTWSHTSLRFARPSEGYRQVRRCKQVLPSSHARLLRPPWGQQSLTSRLIAALLGYQVVLWTDHARDWAEKNAQCIQNKLMQAARPGSIFLLHDAIFKSPNSGPLLNRSPMINGLAAFLDAENENYDFVTLPVLLKSSAVAVHYEQYGW